MYYETLGIVHRRRIEALARRSGCQPAWLRSPALGTESLQTLCWREMDSNYWSRQGETPLGRHVVSAHGSTSVTSPWQQPASDRRYLQPATISHLAIVLRTFRSFGPGTRSTEISRC